MAFIMIGAYIAYLMDKKRTAAFRHAADDLQFDFAATDASGFLNTLMGGSLHLFSQGCDKEAYNILRGLASGLEVAIFDYDYRSGSGRSRRMCRQSVIAFRFDGPPLPAFSVRPENVWHKLGQLFGYQDIDFNEHPTFSSRYLLRGPDEAAVRELFTDDVLSFCETMHGVSIEADGDRLLFYRHERRIKPAEVRSFLEEGFKVLAVFRPPGDAGATATPRLDPPRSP
jgi:hypothetical protein